MVDDRRRLYQEQKAREEAEIAAKGVEEVREGMKMRMILIMNDNEGFVKSRRPGGSKKQTPGR